MIKKDISFFQFYGDYGRLRQMLVTVLDNAIKFSEAGTDIHLVISADQDHCIVNIINTGVGISEDDLPHIFEEYHKKLGETNKMGTGLGLAIAKRIADQHDIIITATSVPNKETIFTFQLNN